MRLFVALDIPHAVRLAIAAAAAKWEQACRAARWVRIEDAHVTLKFIGEIPSEKVAQIQAALASVRGPARIELTFRGVGFFPNAKRPRVFWAGIEAGPELAGLAGAVEAVLEPQGIARESRPFSPHLTLARFDSPAGLERLHAEIAAAGTLDFGRAAAEEFHLYQSVLKRGGAEYTRLASYRLEGDNPR